MADLRVGLHRASCRVAAQPLAAAGADTAGATDKVTVVCPAVDQDERPRTNYPFGSTMPIGLVVVGKAKLVKEGAGDSNAYDVQVDRVLYGSVAGKQVHFTHPWTVTEGEAQVFALVPTAYEDSYELKYTLDASEVSSQEALAEARLDFHTLAAQCIFIGKDLSTDGGYLHTVAVVRGLYGATPAKGQKVMVQISEFIRNTDKTPVVRGEEMIYFIQKSVPGKDVYDMPEDKAGETVYVMDTRLRADQEPLVLAALKRRDTYPVVEETAGGETTKIREVFFRGSIADAIDLMGSTSEAAATLGARR